ncbi:MAG TPA: aminotransferase class V-fold PLP-dependent enzyme [Candidatus Limnocylindria bacterium]|nr:aminotransferase class V-fold PLP-dependent enzyme [Candidatus Limnocylindria bacterium]
MPEAGILRDEFPITARLNYLNNCSLTPMARRVGRALDEYARLWGEWGGRAWYSHWMDELEALRADFARVLGADPDEIALQPGVSTALVAAASAIDYSRRDTVVVADVDFPTDGHVFLARAHQGVEVRFVHSPDGVSVPLDAFADAIDERTALVCTGHVFYASGAIQDVAALATLAHDKGALLLVDAYQSVGAFPFDVHAANVDFLAGGTLKWLMGGPGMAFLYVRRDLSPRLRPTALGWWSQADPFAFDVQHLELPPTARRFEYGTPSVPTAYAARAGLALLGEVGIDRVRASHKRLSQRLVDGARAHGLRVRCPIDPERRTSIVTVEHPDPHAAVDALRERGIIVDSRPGVVRLSPHFFNTETEIDAAVTAMVEVSAARV